MRTLHLHIGHGKTGSSFLQSCFTLSRDALAARGIAYPRGRFDGLAAKGKVTPGNGQALLDALDDQDGGAALAGKLEGDALFSSELLTNRLPDLLDGGLLTGFMEAAGLGRLRILLFIRDPMEHLASHHQQVVKRAGETMDLETFAETYDAPMRAAAAVGAAKAAGAEVTIWNYSRERRAVLERTADWLGAPAAAFTQPERKIVNRSLTRDELAVQRIFNRHLGRCGPLVSDPLCEELPEIEAELALLPHKAAWALVKRLKPAMEAVNAAAPAGQEYRVDIPSRWGRRSAERAEITLTEAQLNAIAKRIGAEIARLKERAEG